MPGASQVKRMLMYCWKHLLLLRKMFLTRALTLPAMAGSLPVIVAEAGALPELASTDRGLIFKPGDSRALRLHLEALYSNPDLRYKIGKQAIDYARARTTKNIANEWEQIYNELIKRFNAKV